MNIGIRHIGSYGRRPASIIELIIETNNTIITEEVTMGIDFRVDKSLISNLREIADELENQNNLLDEIEELVK